MSSLVSVAIGGAGADKLAIGGSVAVNEVMNTVEAQVIDGAHVNASGDITISAGDSTTMVVVSGGFAGSSKAAVGAAVSVTDVEDTVEAYVDGPTVNVASTFGKVNIFAGFQPPSSPADTTSIDTGAGQITLPTTLNVGTSANPSYVSLPTASGSQIINITVAGAGAGKFAAGAAISLNWLDNTVEAYVKDGAVVSASGNITISASDNGQLITASIGAAGAGTAAVGAGLAYDYIGGDPGDPVLNIPANPTSTNKAQARAYIDGSTVQSTGGNVSLVAMSNPDLIDVTIGGSGAGKVAIAGSISINFIRSIVDASIVDGATVSSAGDANISAFSSPTATAVDGAAAGAGNVAVGLAGATTDIASSVTARIDDAEVTADDANLSATTDATIRSLTLGGSGSGSFAVGIALAVNTIDNTVEADIADGATVDTTGAPTGKGSVGLSATDASTIDALAFGGAGAGSVAGGGAVAANVVTNTIETEISGSTVKAGSSVSLLSESEARIRALAVGVSGSGSVAVSVSALGNYVGDTVEALIADSNVTAAGSVTVSAEDEAPSFLSWDLTGTSTDQQNDLTSALAGSPISLEGNILAVMVSVAGSGSVAVSAALSGNIVHNTIDANIADSTVLAGVNGSGAVTDGSADVQLSALSSAGIMAITVGVGASGSVAVQATGFGNVITNETEADVTGGSTVKSGGSTSITAKDESQITSIGLSVAASGSAAISAILGANVITNTVEAEVSGSTVDAGTTLDLDAESGSTIYGFAGGVAASGGAAVQVTLAANVVTDATKALIVNASDVDAGGPITVTAKDSSEIDGLAFGVSGSGGGAVGVAIEANVIANTIKADVDDSTVTTDSSFTMNAESSEIIRALALGVSGSGGFAVQVTAMGNAIANQVFAEVTDNSTVTAEGAVTIEAQDVAPSFIPGLTMTSGDSTELDSQTSSSPISLSGNILAIMVSVAGTGGVAVNAALSGNVITNTVEANIIGSTVLAGYNTSGALVSSSAGVSMSALSQDAIMAVTVGVAGSGTVAVNATGFGDVITDTIATTISGGSTVKSGGSTGLTAKDKSNIASLGLSVAGTGAVAVGALIAANVIANTVESEISGSTVTTGSTLSLDAESDATIIGLTTGVAVGAVAGVISLSANVIDGTTEAAILNNGATASNVTAGGDVTITAKDTSEIDAIAIGVSGAGAVAFGLAIAVNAIGVPGAANTVETAITGSTLNTSGALTMSAESSEIIRGFAIGVSGSGGVAVQLTAMGNAIVNSTLSEVTDSTVSAAGDVTIEAQDIAPSLIPGLPSGVQTTIDNATSGSPISLSGNILAVMVSVAGTGGVAVNGVLSGNLISNTIRTDIVNSTVRAGVNSSGTVTNASANVSLSATSSDAIMALTVGVAGSGAVAVNATGFGDVIADTIAATISGGSTVKSGGSMNLSAEDASHITSLAISVAGTGGVAVGALIGANVITNTVETEISGSTVTTGTGAGGTLTLDAESEATIIGLTAGVAGSGAGAGVLSLSANVIDGTTEAAIVNNGATASNVTAGGNVTITAKDASEIDAIAIGVSGTGAVAVGLAIAVNEVGASGAANTVETAITGSTVNTSGALTMSAQSSEIIRGLALGVSGSGGVAVHLTAMGNAIVNSTLSEVTDSTVSAADSIAISAQDIAPSIIPTSILPSGCTLSSGDSGQLNDNLSASPISLSGNILAVMVGVAGTGGVAVNGVLSGNAISNTIRADIINSTVRAGVNSSGTVTNGSANVSLSANSSDAIMALTVGIAGSGAASLNATGFGDVIADTVAATISGASTVKSGGSMSLSATDASHITSIAASVAGAGGLGAGALIGANVITNTVEAEVSGSTVWAALPSASTRSRMLPS